MLRSNNVLLNTIVSVEDLKSLKTSETSKASEKKNQLCQNKLRKTNTWQMNLKTCPDLKNGRMNLEEIA